MTSTDGPRPDALGRQYALRHGDLLLPARSGGVTHTTVGVPGAQRVLQTAIKAVSGVRGPVPAGLTGRNRVPVDVRGGGGGAREETASGQRCAGDGDGAAAAVRDEATMLAGHQRPTCPGLVQSGAGLLGVTFAAYHLTWQAPGMHKIQ